MFLPSPCIRPRLVLLADFQQSTKGGSFTQIYWILNYFVLNQKSTPARDLSDLETGVIDLFVNAVKMLGFPKSLGEIYGFIYISPQPVCLDDIIDRLLMSKGSASQGLRFLKSIGAVKSVYLAGERRDHFVAETRLKKLVGGFIREELHPHLTSGEERLAYLNGLLQEDGEDPKSEFYASRVEQLETWHKQASRLLPFVKAFLGNQ